MNNDGLYIRNPFEIFFMMNTFVYDLRRKAFMKKSLLILCILILATLSFQSSNAAETKPMGFAVPFPNLSFFESLTREEQAYLGIPGKAKFTFRQIQGELILVELLSTYCVNCQRQAPILTELYSSKADRYCAHPAHKNR